MGSEGKVKLGYMTMGMVIVQLFSLVHHVLVLRFPVAELSSLMFLVPSLVGLLGGFVIARLRLMQKSQAYHLREILRKDQKLEDEVRQRQQSVQREERLAAALEGANDGLWDWNIETGAVYYSPRWLTMLGYREGELEPHYKSWERLLHPEDKQDVLQALTDHLEGRIDQFKREFRTLRSDGEWEWVLGRGKVVNRDGSGRPLRAVGTQTKVTDRKRIEFAMNNLVAGTVPAIGKDFFQELVTHLARALEARFALVGALSETNDQRLQPLAAWGAPGDSGTAEHSLVKTPCQQSVDQGLFLIAGGVQEVFPEDELLAELGAEGYMGVSLVNQDGTVLGVLAVVHDRATPEWAQVIGKAILPVFAARASAEIQRQKAESALLVEKERAQVTLYSIGDGVITTDAAGRIEYMNPAAQQITGWHGPEAVGKSTERVITLVREKSYEPVEDPVRVCLDEQEPAELDHNSLLIRNDGSGVAVEASVSPLRDREARVTGTVLVFRDVSKAREMARQMTWQATHDPLTGLVNRKEFEQQLLELIDSASALRQTHSLLYLDLDQFKVVNDTSGHSAGDELLRQLTFLLKQDVRQADILARLGGDEFGLLLSGCSLEQAKEIADKLIRTINSFRFSWGGKSFDVGVSIGIVTIDEDSDDLATVMSAADLACYAAKDLGRNRMHVYQPDDIQLVKRHGEMQWVSRIQRALEEDRFRLYVQEIRELQDAAPKHYEVMVRMLDENGQPVSPQSFIPAAERYNLMPEIDEWVVVETLRRVSSGQSAPGVTYAVNLSGKSFGSEKLLAAIRDAVDRYPVDARAICFEVTETAAIANLSTAVEFMRQLRAMGFCFALDDFGSGLSSFAYLKNLPVDYLKIDGSFVKDMVEDPIDRAMVRAINEIGHTMGIQTIAEFVENAETLAYLEEIGVDFAQGYFIDRPQPLDMIFPTLAAGRA